MSIEDWLISLGLIVLVLRQIRGKQLTPVSLLWPVALVVWAAFEYLGGVPGDASDWTFVAVLGVIGLAFGIGCGALTRVYHDTNVVMARATGAAAALWIIGMAGRLAFGLFAENGGGNTIATLSAQWHLHSVNTWATALITMSLCEVLSRTLVLLLRYATTAAALKAERAEGGSPARQLTGSPLSGN
ncbi:MAG TPA: hypothetical protein VHX38_28505 [Pseudonocardiaceae bacterium]|jgi:hypothetical protein|nr:hypothetical protein [Pseudonocardiaceae bacterium]